MVSLYNCKHDGDQYRITKFTDQMEIESSYLVDPTACECPAFEKRGRCKHQEMLPYFVNRRAINTGEFYDWERGGWVRMFADDEPLTAEGREVTALPEGVTVIGLDDPAYLHDTIAEAVGEIARVVQPEQMLVSAVGPSATYSEVEIAMDARVNQPAPPQRKFRRR